MSIARKSLAVFGSRFAVLIITMATGIVVNRLLGAEGRGVYVLATGLAFIQLQNLASLGLQVANQVFLAKDRDLLGRLHAWALVLTVVVGIVMAAIVWVFWHAFTRGVFRGIAPLHLILVTACIGPAFYWMAWQGLMIGLGEVKAIALFNLGLAIVQNAAIVAVLGIWKWSAVPVPWETIVDRMVILFVAVLAVSTLVMAAMLRRHGSLWGRLEFPVLRRLLSFGGRVYIGNYASGLLNQLDQIIVNAFVGFTALGVYNQAASLAAKLWLVSAAIENSAYAPVTGADKTEARRLTVDLFRVTFWISIGLIVVGWALSPLIPVIYGPEFKPTIAPFCLLILGTAVFGCGRMFSMYFTGNRKSPQTLLVLNWILLPVHANLCLWLIPHLEVIGAALATTLTFTVSMVTLLVLFIRDGDRPGFGRLFLPQPEDLSRVRALWRRATGRSA